MKTELLLEDIGKENTTPEIVAITIRAKNGVYEKITPKIGKPKKLLEAHLRAAKLDKVLNNLHEGKYS